MLDSIFVLMNWLMTRIWLTLGQHWVLSIAIPKPLYLPPFSKEQMVNQSPLGICYKNCPIPGQTLFFLVFASCCGRSHFGHWLPKKVQSHCCPGDQPNTFCLHCSGSPSAPQSFLPSFDSSVPPPVSPSAGTTSPPAAASDRFHQVKPASFDCQGNQFIKDPPPFFASFWPNQMQPIPD